MPQFNPPVQEQSNENENNNKDFNTVSALARAKFMNMQPIDTNLEFRPSPFNFSPSNSPTKIGSQLRRLNDSPIKVRMTAEMERDQLNSNQSTRLTTPLDSVKTLKDDTIIPRLRYSEIENPIEAEFKFPEIDCKLLDEPTLPERLLFPGKRNSELTSIEAVIEDLDP